MKQLFDNLSVQISKKTTTTYSTSFSLGIYFLNNSLRNPIYSIYGFVRLADEIVDSFSGYDQRQLLHKFREETFQAIEDKISCNPILNSFQQVVNKFEINKNLITAFFNSMEMDLQKIQYSRNEFEEYIFGSAEVVGLMCLHVFTAADPQLFDQLRPYAMKLGAAFQKVNFLRDMNDDYRLLGRTYFPGIEMNEFNMNVKKQIEADIENDFKVALEGIRKLPASSKGGVYLAYVYYKSLFKKIKKLPAHHVMNRRVRINNGAKFGLMINSLLIHKMKLV